MATEALHFRRKNTEILYIRSKDYDFQDGDILYFTVKPEPDNDSTDSAAIIKKQWTVGVDAEVDEEGYVRLQLTPSDTDVDFGEYFYDIKLVSGSVSETLAFGHIKVLPVTTLEH